MEPPQGSTKNLPLADTWDGDHVTASNPSFDFEAMLQAAIDREDLLEDEIDDLDNLFSLSPLTSLEPSPPPSPFLLPETHCPFIDNFALNDRAHQHFEPSSNKSKPKPKERRARRKFNAYATREKKRLRGREAFDHYQVREKVRQRYVNDPMAIDCDVKLEGSNVTSTGYTGLDDKSRPTKVFSLNEVVGDSSPYKFRLVRWNGRDAIPIRDAKRRVIAVLAGHPEDAAWARLAMQAACALEEKHWRVKVPKNKVVHHRGTFVALSTGVSHGQGQTSPSNLANKGENGRVMQELNGMEAFKRIAGFASSVMASWAPQLYKRYVETISKLHEKDSTLKRNFPSSIFSAATYNFGPQTACFKHTDFANLPFGWCSVTALGSYDPTKGGHLILWDCHLVIEFPPGSTILLPSAIVAHSNTAISNHETRYSFAQYTAGALFRWVANGHQKATVYLDSLSKEESQELKAKNKVRFEEGLSLLPTLKKAGREIV